MEMRRIFTALVLLVAIALTEARIENDVTDTCKRLVLQFRDKIGNKTEENHMTSIIWDFWQCIGDTEILDDANAMCDIIGAIISNVTHFHLVKDHFIEKQMFAACDMCDQAANHLQGIPDHQVNLALEWVQSQIHDPELANAVQEHGSVLATKLIESIYPQETCSYLTGQCEISSNAKKIPIPQPIKDFFKELLNNVTHCLECNLCENAILFAQMHILPSPKLPKCVVNLVEENVCVMLNQTIPGIGTQGYELCVKAINSFVGDIIHALWTFLHPNLVCKTALKVCTSVYTDNILGCVCDNVRLPSILEPLMPCHWKQGS